jgi:hypothetical protein
VFVRNGKLIDPGDDSEGARDRPPTDEAKPAPELKLPADAVPQEDAAINKGAAATAPGGSQAASVVPTAEAAWFGPLAAPAATESPKGGHSELPHRIGSSSAIYHRTALAGVALALSSAGRDWQRQLDRALAAAKPNQWKRLKTAGHRRPRKPR